MTFLRSCPLPWITAPSLGAVLLAGLCALTASPSGPSDVAKLPSSTMDLVALSDQTPGTVAGWGSNYSGSLGTGQESGNSSTAIQTNLSNVVAVAASDVTFAIVNDGSVKALGNGTYGALGDGSTGGQAETPRSVVNLTNVTDIAAHYLGGAALSDGNVWVWGHAPRGELGNGTSGQNNYSSVPVKVEGLTNVTSISAEGRTIYALRADGTVWAWGGNGAGQIGDGTYVDRSRPVQVSNLSGVKAIAAYHFGAYALLADGTVRAWGSNRYEELGGGASQDCSASNGGITMTCAPTPVAVNGLSDVIDLGAGASTGYALLRDRSIRSWGFNLGGALGAGLTVQSSKTPVSVTGIATAVQVSASGSAGYALLADGTVRGWGYNEFGTLGDGTTTNRSTPVAIPGVAGVTSLSPAAGSSSQFAVIGRVARKPPTAKSTGGPTATNEVTGGCNPAQLSAAAQRCHADPVNTATGSLTEAPVDLVIPGRGSGLSIARGYDSAQAGVDGPFGKGWTSNYDMKLIVDPSLPATTTRSDAKYLDVIQENGSRIVFQKDISGQYAPPTRVLATLTRPGGGTWKLTRRGKASFTFNDAGQLISTNDLNGNTTTLTYTNGQLSTVTDGAGRSLAFTWSNGKISKIVGPLGRTVAYGYDAAGTLASVTMPDGGVQKYGYDSITGRMTTMTTPRGGVTTTAYDNRGRVTQQTDALGKSTSFDYNGEGPVGVWTTTITDARGTRTEETYSDGLLLKEVKAVGTPQAATTSYTYDPVTLGVTQVTDPLGRVTTTTRDAAGQPLTITDPLNRVAKFTYDARGNVLTSTDTAGVVTTNTYDARGNLLATSTPITGTGTSNAPGPNVASSATATASSENTFSGQTAAKAIDGTMGGAPNDPTTEWSAYGGTAGSWLQLDWPSAVTLESVQLYDRPNADDQVTGGTLTFSDGSTVAVPSLNNLGGPTAVTFPARATTSLRFTVDAVSSTTNSAGLSEIQPRAPASGPSVFVQQAYGDAAHPGDLTASTNANGKTTTYTYDNAGNLVTITDPLGNTSSATYDAAGQKLTSTTARGNVTGATAAVKAQFTTTTTYNAAGRVAFVTDSLGRKTSYGYDADGNPTTVTDPKNQVATTTYDLLGRATQITRADGSITKATYDAGGLLASSTNAAGKITSYTYDPMGRPLTITDPLGRVATSSYDVAGQRTSTTDANGKTTSYTYDTAGQLTKTTYNDPAVSGTTPSAGTPDVTYTYDSAGRPKTMLDATGTTTWVYDQLDRLTSVTNGAGAKVAYGYDAAGQQASLTYPGTTGTVSRTFDAAGRMTALTDPLGKTFTFSYDAEGHLTSTTYPNKVNTGYAWDQAGQLTGNSVISNAGANPVTLATFTNTLDANGLISATTTTGTPASDRTYNYDKLGQLTTAATTGTSPTTTAMTYDAADNITTTDAGAALAYDVANQLTSATPAAGSATSAATRFSFDANGQRTASTTGTGTSATSTGYTWDQAGRLVKVTPSSGGSAGTSTTYTYDGSGLRQQATTAGSTAPPATPTPTVLAQDSFARTVTAGLGSADVGGAWTASSTSKTAVADGAAAFTLTTGSTLSAYLGSVTSADTDVTVSVALDKPATGGGAYLRLIGRRVSATSDYRALVRVASDKSVQLNLERTSANPASASLGGTIVNGLSIGADQKLTMRLQVTGTNPTTVKAKVWAAGTSEPSAWQLSATDATAEVQAAGGIGLSTYLSGSATNAPIVASFSDLVAISTVATTTTTTPAPVTTPTPAVLAQDSFARTVTSGLGSADVGGVWTSNDNNKTSVSNGGAAFSLTTGSTINTYLGSVSSTDTDATVSVKLDKPATGGGAYLRLVGRRVSASSDYRALARATSDGSVQLSIERFSTSPANANLSTTAVSGLTAAAGSKLNLRLQVTGTNPTALKAKVWAAGSTEPTSWQVSTTDSTAELQTAGGVGLSTYLSGSATNAPIVATFSDLKVTSTTATTPGTTGTTTTQAFTWDVSGGLPLLLSDEANYVYGPGGIVLEQISGTTPTYLSGDTLGSVRLLTNTSASVVGAVGYSPFGTPTRTGSATSKLGFAGEYADATGLLYLRARYYDPSTSQMLSRDPLEAVTGQPYAYAANSPLNRTDPSGAIDVGAALERALTTGATGRATEAYLGFFNGLTGGLTSWVSEQISPGSMCTINTDSGWYVGGDITGTVTGFAVPIAGEVHGVAMAVRAGRLIKAAPRAESALESASRLAYKAADEAAGWSPSAKHLPGAGGRFNKFNGEESPQDLAAEALRSPSASFSPTGVNGDRISVIAEMNRTIGTRGETRMKVVLSPEGGIITGYPVK